MSVQEDGVPGPDEPASPEELAGAEALATRLEAKLPEDRAEAVLRRILAAGALPLPAPARRVWWRWALPAGGLVAAATAAGLLLLGPLGRQELALPAPPVALLQAQAAALSGDPLPLRREMGAYRRELLASLEARYRGTP